VFYLRSISARWPQSFAEPDGNVAGSQIADRSGAPHAPGHVGVDIVFGFTAAISTGLFFYNRLLVWSVFAKTLRLPLLLAMFVVNYLDRVWVLPRSGHTKYTSRSDRYGPEQ
jgi:hypothetical protein